MMTLPNRPTPERDENGAMAIMVALMAVVLFFAAALAVDISSLAMERQQLHDNVDSAAHAGAYELPGNGTGAQSKATSMAKSLDSALDPDVDLWCIVASTGSAQTVKADQIPATCYPGPPPYSGSNYPGLRCNTTICAIPCFAAQGDQCNAMRVREDKDVPFGFASVGEWLLTQGANDRREGNTGAVTTVACKGSCGNESPNPMNIVFMADRTTSMSDSDRSLMKNAILSSLKTMTPSMHYVAFGALHKSRTTGFSSPTCRTEATPFASALSYASNVKVGTWMPLSFSNNYLTTSATPTLNSASPLVAGINCLPASGVPGFPYGSYGTHLAGALKGAARYLLGIDSNNLSSLPARPGTPKKVIIFETDGMPDEILDEGSTSLGLTGDIGSGFNSSGSNGQQGCDKFEQVAQNAKDEGVTIITIGFGNAATARCKKSEGSWGSSSRVRDVLARAASPDPQTGEPSEASSCDSAASRTDENTDGDFFFCAAAGGELADIFKTAIVSVSDSIRFVQMP